MVVQVRMRSYREFLTPVLHRRFARAASLMFLVCYIDAVIIGNKSSILWLWFPFGPAGLRTSLLFISSLSIFVLRMGQIHIGARSTASPFETFKQYLFRFNTLQTLGFYFFSAWWFSEVYLWSAPANANLHWVAEGKSYERPQLNDRPIFLRTIHLLLAAIQSAIHLSYDYDKIVLPPTESTSEKALGDKSQIPPTFRQLKTVVPRMLQKTVTLALIVSLAGPFVYVTLLQQSAWIWTMYFTKMIWNVSKASEPSWFKPFHYSMFLRSFSSGVVLLSLWEISNIVLTVWVAQAPLKVGNPLTDESKDPNSSLLNGLSSKKEITKTFAFWELLCISQRFEKRRKSIFLEIDRKGGSTWTQMMKISLATVQAISIRINEYQNPPELVAQSQQQNSQYPHDGVKSLPRILAPLKEGSVFTKSVPSLSLPERYGSTVGTLAKSFGQNHNSGSPLGSLSPQAKQYLSVARDKLMTREQQKSLSPANFNSSLNDYLMKFLRSRLGPSFRQTVGRRLCVVVLGKPYSELGLILSAIDSLTSLAVASLEDDQYGTVHKDVPLLFQTFVTTITNIQILTQSFSVHWTDVEFSEKEGEGRRVAEIDMLVGRLKLGLKELINAFGDYAIELGLTLKEMREARQAAGLDVS